jgi:hypothetical protein
MNVHHAVCVIFTVDNINTLVKVSLVAWLDKPCISLSQFTGIRSKKKKVVLVKVGVFGLYNPEKHVHAWHAGRRAAYIRKVWGVCI